MSRNKHSEVNQNVKSEEITITKGEFERIEKAFKNDEFKKLFFDYCEEIQDPENRKIYEEEIIQLEAERGVNVTFVNPKPGFVLITSVDGSSKCFINIAQCDKIEKPSNQVKDKGLVWSIPYAQSPPRHDYENNKKCFVYDVVFHPDAILLSERSEAIRKHVIEVALDAIEREFKVKLDRANVKPSKLKFKGNCHPTVIRSLSKNGVQGDSSPLDSIYPPLPSENKTKHVFSEAKPSVEFQTPKFLIKHRHGVDFTEMTYHQDAKLNVTIPKELCVEIELPLLKSTAQCTLDVMEKKLLLSSDKPAKYRLDIDLPYPVDDKRGSAKFDTELRKLLVLLPVKNAKKTKNMRDLYREDSGVESDVREDNLSCSLNSSDHNKLIEVLSSIDGDNDDNETEDKQVKGNKDESFLQPNIHYNFPHNFDCNSLDDELAFVLHVKNVDPESIKTEQTDKSVHLKFTSIGSGYYPTNYAFYFELENTSNREVQITATNVEAWDNNVILNATLLNPAGFKGYSAGLDAYHTQFYNLLTKFDLPSKTQDLEENLIEVSRSESDESVEISIRKTGEDENKIDEEQDVVKKDSKKPKKKNKKRRSLSESNSDDLIAISEEVPIEAPKDHIIIPRKQRSFSECRDDGSVLSYKSILKPRSSYDRSYSTSSSISDDGQNYSCSVDVLRLSESIGDIPEEHLEMELSESCKKTVRFSDVIQKQLFRLDSSILGQRKKNQKRKIKKQRAMQRRNSEGDSADYEDNKLPIHQPLSKKERKLSNNDSGLDLTASEKARRDSESSEMFDLEM
ncbi:DNAAF2 family protein [Megaselia abdita]